MEHKASGSVPSPYRDNPEWTIEAGVLVKYVGFEREITVPEGVHAIGDRAFRFAPYLEDIRIPDSVRTMGVHPFHGCHRLNNVRIPKHLLEGMTPYSVLQLFTEEVRNLPSVEYHFTSRILDGADESSQAFRELILQRVRDPFHAVRWIFQAIREDKPRWVEAILELGVELTRDKVEECILEASRTGKTGIAAILTAYIQAMPEEAVIP